MDQSCLQSHLCLFFHCWLFVNSFFYFRPFQISGLKVTLFLTALAFYICDVSYRLPQALVFSHFNLTHLQVLPRNVLFFLCLCIQVSIITKHFCSGPRNKQLSLFLSLTIPCFSTYVTGILVTYFIYPAYNRQDHIVGKALIAIFTPLISVILKRSVALLCPAIVEDQPSGTFFCAVGSVVL